MIEVSLHNSEVSRALKILGSCSKSSASLIFLFIYLCLLQPHKTIAFPNRTIVILDGPQLLVVNCHGYSHQ